MSQWGKGVGPEQLAGVSPEVIAVSLANPAQPNVPRWQLIFVDALRASACLSAGLSASTDGIAYCYQHNLRREHNHNGTVAYQIRGSFGGGGGPGDRCYLIVSGQG